MLNTEHDEPAQPQQKTVAGGGGMRIPLNGKLDARKNVKMEPRPFEELPAEVQKILSDRQVLKKESKNSPIELIEGKHVIRLILYLDKMSPVVKSDIYNDVARNEGMPRKIDALRRAGIVEIYYTARANMSIVMITPKGREIARLLRDIFDILDGEPESESAKVDLLSEQEV